MKQLTLSFPAYNPKLEGPARGEPKNIGYRIERVVGDVDHKPGDFLSQLMVRDLCAMTGIWKITMERVKNGK